MSNVPNHEATVQAAARRLLDCRPGGDEAARAMVALVASTAQVQLVNFNAWERIIRAELHLAERRPAAASWQFWRKRARFGSWLDLCSHNGFERERFLRAVSGGAPNRFFFALALRRLNDWVPEVRAAARECLPELARHTPGTAVVDALWVTFPHWSSWMRMGTEDRAVLLALLNIPDVALALKSRIVSATSGAACTVFAQASRSPALDSWMGDIARNASQPSVRAKAYRYQLEGRTTWLVGRKWVWTDVKWCKGRFDPVVEQRPLSVASELVVLLNDATIDPSPMVRRVGAELLIRFLDSVGPKADAIARRLAADRPPSVAERGRFALERLGQPG